MGGQQYSLVQAMIAGLLFSLPAQAQQEMTWQQRESEGMVFLAYELQRAATRALYWSATPTPVVFPFTI